MIRCILTSRGSYLLVLLQKYLITSQGKVDEVNDVTSFIDLVIGSWLVYPQNAGVQGAPYTPCWHSATAQVEKQAS